MIDRLSIDLGVDHDTDQVVAGLSPASANDGFDVLKETAVTLTHDSRHLFRGVSHGAHHLLGFPGNRCGRVSRRNLHARYQGAE
jgi:hypothetical protein